MHNKGEVLTEESVKKGEEENLLTICFNGKHINIHCRSKDERDRAYIYMQRRIKQKNIAATPKRIKYLFKDSIGYEVELKRENCNE